MATQVTYRLPATPSGLPVEELLTALLRDEFRLVTELFAKYPHLREFFDFPEAIVQQRSACFALLAHRRLIDEIDENFRDAPTPP